MNMPTFPMTGSLLECQNCKRKILVERAINGVSHTVATFVNCWDCLDADAKNKAKLLLYDGVID